VAFLYKPALASTSPEENRLVTINKFASHPALDAAVYGIEGALNERGLLKRGVTVRINNAQGNIATAVQIAKSDASLKPFMMIGVATPSAQAVLKAKEKGTFVAFVAVTNPDAIGFIEGPDRLGVIDAPPIKELIKLSLKLMPNVKTIGVVFNPGEVNSVEIVERLEKVVTEYNVRIEKAPVTSSTNIKSATQALIDKVDLIYLPADNMVVSGIESLMQVSLKAKIPVIANDTMLVNNKVLLALGCDYFESGAQLGNMIADLIEDKPISKHIQSPRITDLKINEQVASELGITLQKDSQYKSNAEN